MIDQRVGCGNGQLERLDMRQIRAMVKDVMAGKSLPQEIAGHATIPVDLGLFLEETWRLHPDICAFASELFH
jgi:hypothetical protein